MTDLSDLVDHTDLADASSVVGELPGESHHVVLTDGNNLARAGVKSTLRRVVLLTSTEKLYL